MFRQISRRARGFSWSLNVFLGVKYIIRRFFTKINFTENLVRDPGSPKASHFAESDLESVYLDPKHWRLSDDIC
jgi:hypothetical protein